MGILFKITQITVVLFLFGMLVGCDDPKEISSFNPNHWEDHYADPEVLGLLKDSLQNGKTYLSIYSHIYSFTLEKSQNLDRKSTRLNSSHVKNSYAVFCLKKKKRTT